MKSATTSIANRDRWGREDLAGRRCDAGKDLIPGGRIAGIEREEILDVR
jgi:hypothetical protein